MIFILIFLIGMYVICHIVLLAKLGLPEGLVVLAIIHAVVVGIVWLCANQDFLMWAMIWDWLVTVLLGFGAKDLDNSDGGGSGGGGGNFLRDTAISGAAGYIIGKKLAGL